MLRRSAWAAVCMMLGILAAPYIKAERYVILLCLLAAACIAKLVLSRKTKWFPAFLAFLFLGMAIYTFSLYAIEEEMLLAYQGKERSVSGRIESIPEEDAYGRQRCKFLVYEVDGKREKIKAMLTIEGESIYRYGDSICFTSAISKPQSALNEGEFDYRSYLRSSGISAVLYAKDVTYSQKTWKGNPILNAANSLREKILLITDKYFKGERQALLEGILIGFRGNFTDRLNDIFSKSGLTHVVAVSGSHVSILLSIFMCLLSPFGKKNKIFIPLYLAIIGFFIVLTGAEPSAVRSGIMCALFLIAPLFLREADALSSLFVAVIIMLIFRPFVLYNVGFQLSAAATLGILLFSAPISERLEKFLPSWLNSIVSVTLSAQIFIIPITIFAFHQFTVLGLLANLIVVPLTPFLMGFGIVASLVCALLPALASPFVFIVNSLMNIVLITAKIFASMPLAYVKIYAFDIFSALAYCALAVAVYQILTKKRFIPFVAAASILILCSVGIAVYEDSCSFIDFINVGQGDCTLLRQGRCAVLIDSGEQSYKKEDTYLAENTVIPYLKSRRIRRINAVFASHYHEDHVNALIPIVKEGMAERLFLPDTDAESENRIALEEAARETNTPVTYIMAGDRLNIGDMNFRVLSPNEESKHHLDENEHSAVIKAEYASVRILFAGDIGFETEEKLPKEELFCDILKVAHHGSKYSSGEEFLRNAQPLYCVISSGRSSPEHPSNEALERLYKYSEEVFVTEEDGTVTFRITKDGRIIPRTLY